MTGADMQFGDIVVSFAPNAVAAVEIRRPPNNYFDTELVNSLADALEAIATDKLASVVVLRSDGKHFCAGRDNAASRGKRDRPQDLYTAAERILAVDVPIVAAVQGAAVGGGFGLALAADFRVASRSTRFWPNFVKIGLHHGFGMTVTLPTVIGDQAAYELLMTGRKMDGAEAAAVGLVDRLAEADQVQETALDFATELAVNAPLALFAVKATMRRQVRAAWADAVDRESDAQEALRSTDDYREGVAAMAQRREPNFRGR